MRVMRLLIMFDLPTKTQSDKRPTMNFISSWLTLAG